MKNIKVLISFLFILYIFSFPVFAQDMVVSDSAISQSAVIWDMNNVPLGRFTENNGLYSSDNDAEVRSERENVFGHCFNRSLSLGENGVFFSTPERGELEFYIKSISEYSGEVTVKVGKKIIFQSEVGTGVEKIKCVIPYGGRVRIYSSKGKLSLFYIMNMIDEKTGEASTETTTQGTQTTTSLPVVSTQTTTVTQMSTMETTQATTTQTTTKITTEESTQTTTQITTQTTTQKPTQTTTQKPTQTTTEKPTQATTCESGENITEKPTQTTTQTDTSAGGGSGSSGGSWRFNETGKVTDGSGIILTKSRIDTLFKQTGRQGISLSFNNIKIYIPEKVINSLGIVSSLKIKTSKNNLVYSMELYADDKRVKELGENVLIALDYVPGTSYTAVKLTGSSSQISHFINSNTLYLLTKSIGTYTVLKEKPRNTLFENISKVANQDIIQSYIDSLMIYGIDKSEFIKDAPAYIPYTGGKGFDVWKKNVVHLEASVTDREINLLKRADKTGVAVASDGVKATIPFNIAKDKLNLIINKVNKDTFDLRINKAGQEVQNLESNITLALPYSADKGQELTVYRGSDIVKSAFFDSVLSQLIIISKNIGRYSVKTVNIKDFKDTKGHWAKNAISFAVNRKIAYGYGDNTFRPDNTVTRQEFLSLLNQLTGKRLKLNFSDKTKIRRKDVAYLIYNEYKTGNEKAVTVFKDCVKLNNSYKLSLNFVYKNKIMVGNSLLFKPEDYLTRAEAVQVIKALVTSGVCR